MKSRDIAAERSSASSSARVYRKHPLFGRYLHWSNFVVMAALLWTAGLLLSGTPELPYSHWFPPGFYAALHLDGRNTEGRVWHVLFSLILIGIALLYVVYLAGTGAWRRLLPTRESWRDAWLVVLSELGVRKHQPTELKYNGAQRIAYTAALLLIAGEILTGVPILWPDGFGWLGRALGGPDAIRAEHFGLMLALIVFIVVHLVQVARAGWNNFRAMLTGTEIVVVGAGEGVEKALPEPDRLSSESPTSAVNAEVSRASRRALMYAGAVAVAILAFVGWAHTQSLNQGEPTWLRWAEDRDAGNAGAPAPEHTQPKAPAAEGARTSHGDSR